MIFSLYNSKRANITIFVLAINATLVFTQSPPDLSTDRHWEDSGGIYNPANGQFDATFNGIIDIETAFNNGRRAEEQQFNLPTNALGFLQLPNNYMAMNVNQRALMILNAERVARTGQDYGNGSVKGLPIEAVEGHLLAIAEQHAQDMMDNNTFSHLNSSGESSFQRIDNDPVLGNGTSCHENIGYAENLAGYWTAEATVPLSLERAIYDWLYRDASSGWEHRRMMLIQDADNYGKNGFNNNHSNSAHEGFVAFAVLGVNDGAYNPFNFTFGVDRGEVVVMNIVDPANNNCGYQKLNMPFVDLTHFSARQVEQSILLEWTTAAEQQVERFVVEHSIDGDNFYTIGTVAGSGTTSQQQQYQLMHAVPVNGMNYYRLRSEYTNGEQITHQVITHRFRPKCFFIAFKHKKTDSSPAPNTVVKK